jgi:transcriptional antiterminator RfaH
MTHWYAVQTKPRQETIAEQNLQRQDFVTYLPRISLRKRKRNKWVDAVEPLFPRYLFIQVDPDKDSLAPVRSTLGVAGLVRFGQLLRSVPDTVIDYIKLLEDPQTEQRQAETWPHKPGDTLEVLEGPFASLTGIYQMPLGENRALLLIELLGRSNSVAVAKEALAAPN